MPRLKLQQNADDRNDNYASKAPRPKLSAPSADAVNIPSPALALQTHIEDLWDADNARSAPHVAKIPFGWTLFGMAAVSAVFWYSVAVLIF
jgi:hypothetical protein